LPGGQLDGGHILFSVFPKLHRWASLALVVALIPVAKYFWVGWLIWAVVLWLTSLHPPIPKRPGISPARKWLAAFAIVMLALTFTPAPFTHSSGREVWPQIRDAARDTLHSADGGIRQVLHRK
jgi:membrane-associated protease RseP (regulator of RpoE activity)